MSPPAAGLHPSMQMGEILLPLAMIAGYILLMRFVLPKLGVPT